MLAAMWTVGWRDRLEAEGLAGGFDSDFDSRATGAV